MKLRDCLREILGAGGGASRELDSVVTACKLVRKVSYPARNALTAIHGLAITFWGGDFDVDKVHLEFLVRLHTDEERRTTSRRHNLTGEVSRLEDEGKRALELLQNSLDERRERHLFRPGVVKVLRENGDGLRVRFGFEFVAMVLQELPQGSSIGDDTVVNNHELVIGAGANGMAVDGGGRPVSGPAGVGNGDLGNKGLGGVNVGLSNALAKSSHFAHFLEVDGLSWFVAVDTDTRRVISTILLTGKTVAKDLQNLFAVL